MVFVESPSNRAFAISAAVCAVMCGVLKAGYQGAAAADADGDQHFLLVRLQTGSDSLDRESAEVNLERNRRSLETLFDSMPKNGNGRLEPQTASYMLHRFFVRRHGWFLKDLQSQNETFLTWSTSSPIQILEQHVPDKLVVNTFRDRVNHVGLDLKDVAAVASTIEHLARGEALKRLRLSYSTHGVMQRDILSKQEALQVLHIYMSIYILGYGYGNISTMTPKVARTLNDQILELFPAWPQTQQFSDEVFESFAPKRDYLFFGEVESVFAEVTDRYGHYQDVECREMKDWLASVEDNRSADGAGRVRLPDFYNLALNEGRWQFSESREYLRQLGALDESDISNPRVIIPNYVYAPSNCVASSAYYSVCCLDECEGILGVLEQKLSEPKASAAAVADAVRMIPSSTVSSNRTLPPWLLHRLDQIASHHYGYVPIHGRLFLQWLHYAYPRECHFPHIPGTINRKRPEDFEEGKNTTEASKEEMERIINASKIRDASIDEDTRDESPMWSMTEDLVAPHGFGLYSWRRLVSLLHCREIAFTFASLSFAFAAHRIYKTKPDFEGVTVKHFV
mmetsp:Transcript_105449/g.166468  ORF Transcript_105449/g.166468 Transcript_105449/m.166468 type:complete len:567 (-) Transcript_105449:45-1745(-)